jgi:ankyrin repeat protein|eukprot:COSAG02_NODE_180_length_31057_cov_21.869501_15_plen_236_part_00
MRAIGRVVVDDDIVLRRPPLLGTSPPRLLLLALLTTLAPTVADGAAVGFPLGGDGGQELWQAVQDAADNKGMDTMLALLEGGANVNWQNEEMVSHSPVLACIVVLASPCSLTDWSSALAACCLSQKLFTPLIYSSMRGHRTVTNRLLRAGADVHLVSKHHNSALHLAAMHGYEDIVRELLAKGARADLENDRGKTPLDKAYEFEHDYRPKHSGARHSSHIIKLLEESLGGVREDL